MKRKKYIKTIKWHERVYKQRLATMKRNVLIYLGKIKPDLTTQRIEQIKKQVQGMIDRNEVDISLFE